MAYRRRLELSPTDRDRAWKQNEKNGWSFSDKTLQKLYNKHLNGSEYDKALVEYRLTDANFHKESEFLNNEDYEGLAKFHKKEWGSDWTPVRKEPKPEPTPEEKKAKRDAYNARRREQRAEASRQRQRARERYNEAMARLDASPQTRVNAAKARLKYSNAARANGNT